MRKLILLAMTACLLTGCGKWNSAKVPTEKEMSAYLMVYFKDETHGLYMALSPDGYTFTDVNNGEPVMSADTVAAQKGIRDPHIMRGPDNLFYLTMTDLHIFALRDSVRETDWERDGKEFGWGNNRNIIMMKSPDLIHWDISNFRLDTAFPQLDSIGCAWAPQTVYDEEADKLMVYFTMRFKNGLNRLYYSYADKEFTKMETLPELLFQYPKDGISYIDADITKVGDTYRMFYTPQDGQVGVKQAVSDKINSGYEYLHEWRDPEARACEAPNLWKRIGEDKWVLMYDVYTLRPNNMGFSETSDFENFTDLGHFNKGVMKTSNFSSPKHGAVIHLTKKEAERLAKHWGTKIEFGERN